MMLPRFYFLNQFVDFIAPQLPPPPTPSICWVSELLRQSVDPGLGSFLSLGGNNFNVRPL